MGLNEKIERLTLEVAEKAKELVLRMLTLTVMVMMAMVSWMRKMSRMWLMNGTLLIMVMMLMTMVR